MRVIRCCILLGFSLLAAAPIARAGDYSIFPGRGMGHTFLGMTRTAVHHILPPRESVYRRPGGFVEELWGARSASRGNRLEILYDGDRVVQIEATASLFRTSDGLSRNSTLESVRQRFGELNIQAYRYGAGERAFTGYYFDSVLNGIAFAVGLRAPLDSDVRFDTVIVHRLGRPVIPAVGGKAAPASP